MLLNMLLVNEVHFRLFLEHTADPLHTGTNLEENVNVRSYTGDLKPKGKVIKKIFFSNLLFMEL